jgi:MSHA biogenesis protein MshO
MKKLRGFTLLELLAVLTITGILAAVLTVYLRPAIESYLDTRRRANLSDMADTALRRMGQDIRSAVPNSIRPQSPTCFQLVPTITGGRYRKGLHMSFTVPVPSAPLDTTVATTSFDVFNRMRTIPAPNDWVVINNQNTDDVYNGVNRSQITLVQTPSPVAGLVVGQHRITINPIQFSSGYDEGRFVVVANNANAQTVFYSCNAATRTLYRTMAPFNADRAATCNSVNGDIVATNVANCTFVYDPNQGATQQSGFLHMQLQLADQAESVTLVHGVHVENVP